MYLPRSHGAIVYAGMAGERSGQGIRGRLAVRAHDVKLADPERVPRPTQRQTVPTGQRIL
ncbi:hypothetical protein GCM10022380_52570 [Amycolatopsis tucumanensis]|uniref:Uncharacterized protein n=1 Tax=Amycolatopsis tucumanensis TaxID=401106 RepID=A0ABP7IUL0_9PSEU